MRDIIFRGKNIKGKWVYGDLLRNRGETFIAPDGIADPLATAEDFQVNPETVGQYTGLKDRNDKRIFEGDVIKTEFSYATWNGYVQFNKGRFELVDSDKNGQYLTLSVLSNIEVLGNIHDNPELLKLSQK